MKLTPGMMRSWGGSWSDSYLQTLIGEGMALRTFLEQEDPEWVPIQRWVVLQLLGFCGLLPGLLREVVVRAVLDYRLGNHGDEEWHAWSDLFLAGQEQEAVRAQADAICRGGVRARGLREICSAAVRLCSLRDMTPCGGRGRDLNHVLRRNGTHAVAILHHVMRLQGPGEHRLQMARALELLGE